jgi:hypothetical protein
VVHSFPSDSRWRVVIVSSTSAAGDASALRDEIEKYFANDVASGALRVEVAPNSWTGGIVKI